MKSFYLFVSLFIFVPLTLYAQYCPEPTSPQSTINEWDWTVPNFQVHIKNVFTNITTTIDIPSPFFGSSVNQPNVNHLQGTTEKDFLPENGWELVFRDFGEPGNGTRMPFYSLYNRYTGKLRLFYYLADIDGVDQVNLKLKNFSDFANTEHVSAILEHAFTPMDAIEYYEDKGVIIETPNVFEGNAGLWVFADIPMAYDPCTCQYASALIAENTSFESQALNINLEGSGSIEQVVENDEVVNNSSTSFNLNNFGSAISKGTKAYKGANSFIEGVNKSFAKKINENLTPEIINEINNLGFGNEIEANEVNALFNAANGANAPSNLSNFINSLSNNSAAAALPTWLKNAVPYLGAASGLLSFFSGSSTTPPMNFSVDLDFVGTGDIIDDDALQGNRFFTPGSDINGASQNLIPTYNNILGVATLTEKPVIWEAVDIDDDTGNPQGGIYEEKRTYKVGEEIKYAFNPATGLPINKVVASLYFYGCHGDADYAYLIEESNNVWRTPYMPLSCLEDYVVRFRYEYTDVDPYPSEIIAEDICYGEKHLHLVMDLGETFFAAMFKTETQAAPYNYDDTPSNPWVNVPINTTTDDITKVLNDEVVAWNEITVTGGVVITEENLDDIRDLFPKVTITTSIDHDGNPNTPNIIGITQQPLSPQLVPGDVLNEDIILTNPPDCGGEVLPVDAAYLSQLCTDLSRYNPVALLLTNQEDNPKQPTELQFDISPNPARDFLKVGVTLLKDEKITLRIYNFLGQLVDIPVNKVPYSEGENEIVIPLENYPPATYIIELEALRFNEFKGARKFVKN